MDLLAACSDEAEPCAVYDASQHRKSHIATYWMKHAFARLFGGVVASLITPVEQIRTTLHVDLC